jgi:cation transport regulator ChaC
MVAQISRSAGSSGTNIDYVRDLEAALRRLEIDDPHVFKLARRLRENSPPVPGPEL